MSNYRDQLEAWLKTIEVEADSVADVGGGALPIKERVGRWDVQDYQIIDNQIETPKEKPTFIFDMNLPLLKEDGALFDVVFCLELFEYIWNPQQAVVNLSYLTKPGGTLYITFPFIYPIHEPKQADFLRYTADGIARLLGESKFVIQEMIPRTMTPQGFELYKQFIKAEGMHASKHSRHDILGFIVKAKKG